MAEFCIGITFCITNYLDDFLFVAWLRIQVNWMMSEFLKLCWLVGCPIAIEKMEWGTTIIIFLGVLMDGEERCIAIPMEKKTKIIKQLQNAINKKKMIIKHLQSLAGSLNFLCKAIVPGRVFTRHLYAKIPGNMYCLQQQKKLKHYHHVNLDKEFRDDCYV